MLAKLKITENELYTLQDVKYGVKTVEGGKFRNVHCRTWNMTRKLKIMESEKHPLDDLKNDEITEKRQKWKCTLQDLEYGEKLKITENEKYTRQEVKYGEEN